LDEIRAQLQQSLAVLVLLTPASLNQPWLLFETGYGASNPDCDIIPLCIGLDPQRDVPFPLAMYQCFQLVDYESLRTFAQKLLARYEIKFDEDMAKPILQQVIGDFTSAATTGIDNSDLAPEMSLLDAIGEIKEHIDRRFLQLDERQARRLIVNTTGEMIDLSTTYTISIHINLPELSRKQHLEISDNMNVGNVMDKIYFMLQGQVNAFSYLESWVLQLQGTDYRLIIREVQHMIPATAVFTPDREWEVLPLEQPYSATDSEVPR